MNNPFIKRLCHAGVQASNMEASIKWYTEVLGLKEAFRLNRKDGTLGYVYLHVTPTSFIELIAPFGNQKPSLNTHFSIEVDDIEGAVADLKTRLAPESMKSPDIVHGIDDSYIFNFYDPDGNRIEFQKFPPESQQAKAMARAEK
jgi:lactoylglutathione lyase